MDSQPYNPRSKILGRIAAVVVLAALLFGAYRYSPYIKQMFVAAPCSRVITYHIGQFDTQFGISEDEFKRAISEAAHLWETAAGRQLFQYSDTGEMPINLVYDSRQQATEELKKLNLGVDNTEASYNQLKTAYASYQDQYQIQKRELDSAKAQYETDQKNYENQVQYWNSKGGAPPAQYAQLSSERDRLNAEASALNQKTADFNQLVNTINALVSTLNRIGTELNKDVSAYNSKGKNLGEFEEGLYSQDASGSKVDIYQFDDYSMLVRVLAHELGHSLGLEHVDDPNAIMYKLNQSKNGKPTAADIAELKRACKI